MKASVIVPAYNAEQYLAETLDCLLSQTLTDVEILVVNDGSTDATQQILDGYCAGHTNIRAVFHPNAGVSAARNHGLSLAQGEYVLFLDSDDLLTRESLERLCRRLDESGADLAICCLASFGYGGEKPNPFAAELAGLPEIDCLDKRLLWNFLVGNKLYRRSTLLASGVQFPLLRYSEEGVFFMRFVLTGAKIVGEPGACMRYRRHYAKDGLSVSQSINLPLFRDFICSLQAIYDAAQAAVTAEIRADYLQEVLYKTDYILTSQFYRLLWRADAETLSEIQKEHERLTTAMTAETRKKIQELNSDLPQLLFEKKLLAQKPLMSVILPKGTARTAAGIYGQSMPQFELLIPASLREPLFAKSEFAAAENLAVLPDKGFHKAARKAAKAPRVLTLRGDLNLDERLFRLMLRVGAPERLRTMFFRPLYWVCAYLLTKR